MWSTTLRHDNWAPVGTGPTGSQHPFRKRSDRQVRRLEDQQEERRYITVQQLEMLGVPVATGADEGPLMDRLDRLVADRKFERAGVDRVFAAVKASMKGEER